MITFIIGNGFDLNLGMKTRYKDVYKYYMSTPSENETIKKFKKDISGDYENWVDFELGMAKYADNFTSEDDFILCVRNFKRHLSDYLIIEQNKTIKFIDKYFHIVSKEMLRSVEEFYLGFSPNVSNIIGKCIRDNPIVNFITFNYTRCLDGMIEKTNNYFSESVSVPVLYEPIHIHGQVNSDIVLGVDNKSQIKKSFTSSIKLNRAFIKPYFNYIYDKSRVSEAEIAIEQSNVICTFGWSWGETDDMWVSLIKKWLLEDEKNHLVFYKYEDNYFPACNFDERLDREDELRDEFIKRLNFKNEEIRKVKERIHIPICHKIFDFDSIIEKEGAKRTPMIQLAQTKM